MLHDKLHDFRFLLHSQPGVFFEDEKLNTVDPQNELVFTILSLFAQNESLKKSDSIKWSYKNRWKEGVGIYPNWALLGYELDDDRHWSVIDEEADIVRAIYSLYLEGYSSTQIADILTKNEIPTVRGKERWSPGSVLGILKNEKYCGDALCQKTVTIDFFTHRSITNKGHQTQYFIEGHHIPIIPKDEWLAAQQIRKERRNSQKRSRLRVPKPIVKGQLAGFVIIDTQWDDMFVDAYLEKVLYPTTPPPPNEVLEDENFRIEKE